jgi:hypothetical protein
MNKVKQQQQSAGEMLVKLGRTFNFQQINAVMSKLYGPDWLKSAQENADEWEKTMAELRHDIAKAQGEVLSQQELLVKLQQFRH